MMLRTARMWRTRSAVLCLAVTATGFLANSCSSDSSGSPGSDSKPPAIAGEGDRTSSGELTVDKKAISATIDGGNIHVAIPVRSLSKGAKGTLHASLRGVEGQKSFSTRDVSFDLAANADATLNVDLPAPDGLTAQSQLVEYVVRVDDGTDTGVRVTASLLRIVVPYEVRLEGPSTVIAGKKASYRVRAQNAITRLPLGGQPVNVRLRQNDQDVETHAAVTANTGDAVVELTVPKGGSWTVHADAAAQGTSVNLDSALSAQLPGPKVLLTTDKPIYQPGQVVHIRALTLDRQTSSPQARKAVLFEVLDGKGNKISKVSATSDAYGIASTDFVIGGVVNEGDFKVQMTSDGSVAEKTVKVSRYSLPKFKADVSTDKSWYLPGQTVQATVDAAYFFGKAVAGGDVLVEAATLDVGQTVFQKVSGKTDANGKFTFQVKLPTSLVGLPLERGNALVRLGVTCRDTAGQEVKKDSLVVVSKDGLDVVLVPEATAIVPNVENQFDLFVTDPQGQPLVSAHAAVRTTNATLQADTDAYGYGSFRWNPQDTCNSGCSLGVTITVPGKSAAQKTFAFQGQAGRDHLVLRTDKAVYGVGETVSVSVLASTDSGHLYVDWLTGGQTVDMRTLDTTGGAASFRTAVDASQLGANRIEAYVVDRDGNIVRTGRTIFVRKQGGLNVALQTSKPQYRPGERATLTFKVTDETGAPAVAALGVQVVDEAVFSLVDAQPGLLRSYFELEDQFSKPQYEIEGPSGDITGLLFSDSASSDPNKATAAQRKAGATMAALRDGIPAGIALGSWGPVVAQANTLMTPHYDALKATLRSALSKIAAEELALLEASGCTPQQYYCQKLNKDFGTALFEAIQKRASGWDFWGNRLEAKPVDGSNTLKLETLGPDELANTADDHELSFTAQELGLPPEVAQRGAMEDGAAAGAGGPPPNAPPGTSPAPSPPPADPAIGAQPRVRSFFPETLYVNPAIITGPNGLASVDVDMADSITRWRVSSLANAQNGRLGGNADGVTVFQDFFADIDFPASLTRGDEVQFPIAVYNYLATAQDVVLELTAGDWYTPLGATTATVHLNPGQVTGVRFPVRVEKVGTYTLTVKATGTTLSDAVARTVRVEPGGKAFPTSLAGSVGTDAVTQSVTFPANAIPGSSKLYVNVFPAYVSQVVQGMDSMLRVPNGCFEQTTSTVWPNVLVTDYMTKTRQITPEIQLKADSLITAGYQRLLTFEHPGGGYSWFGTQDPAPFLSVTAFGVMEFADMAKVRTVDTAMLGRTTQWLSGKQKADGSWDGDQSEFFSFQTSTLRNTAFVMWALATAGVQGTPLDRAKAYIAANVNVTAQDSYTLGILANALQLVAPNDPTTTTVFNRIVATKIADAKGVHWSADGTQTDFYGSGNDAEVTSTALLVQALLQRGGYPDLIGGGLEYLVKARDPQGNFGSTQATIWTLRALLLAATKGTESAVGTLEVSLDGTLFTTLNLTAQQSDVMNTVDLGSGFAAGSHDVKLSFVGSGKASYHVVSGYNIDWNEVPGGQPGPISVSVAYDKTELAMYDMVTANVTVKNNTASKQNMLLVTLGIPPGFQVMPDKLDALKAQGVLSRYETTGKQLTLYLSKLAANATQLVSYELQATMPVTASDGGGAAYPYYQPDKKTAYAATKFTVRP